MSRHRYPGWKSGLREGCQLISHIPSHTGVDDVDHVCDGGGVVLVGYGGGDDDVNNIDGF